MAAGAYRGYGATQGIFALETSVNELAEKLGIDPTHPGKEHAPGGHENAGILWGNCKCLCAGQMHGAL